MNTIRFCITAQTISVNFGVREERVIHLPCDTCVFHVVLFNGLDIILVGYPWKMYGRDFVQDVSLFDFSLPIRFRNGFDLLLTAVEKNAKHHIFRIDGYDGNSSGTTIGYLELCKDGSVWFNDIAIETANARRLWTKALMLGGSRR